MLKPIVREHPGPPTKLIKVNCQECKRAFYLERFIYNQRIKKTKHGLFCTTKCAATNHNQSLDMRRQITLRQRGVSVLARGRKGHKVSKVTREKIRLAKLGKPAPVDTAIIIKELGYRNIKKYFAMVGLIPDAVFIEDGKLVALEVEKDRWEAGIRKKMTAYNNRPEYEKVILVWYSPTGERLKEWHKYNGEWELVS